MRDTIGTIVGKGVIQSIRHPRSRICFCTNPKKVTQNPVPWQAAMLTLIISLVAICIAHQLGISDLEKAALVLFGAAGGNILGMSISIRNTKVSKDTDEEK
jgi:hypothetical protein